MNELRRRPKLLAVLLLLGVSTAWGATFVVVKASVAHAPVLDFLAWRFLLAGGLLVAVRPRAVLRLDRRGWAQGCVLGSVLSAGYVLQTFGLRYTSAAISGFLTGLQVVFVPLLGWALMGNRPRRRTWFAAALATVGLAVICFRGVSIGAGEVVTVASAALFALQIVALGRWASSEDAYGLATVQLFVVGAVSAVASVPGGVAFPSSPGMWAAVVMTAVAATAFAFVVQSWAQSHLSASSAAMVFTTEPIFAALFAWTAGEPIGWGVVAGGVLVVGAMAVQGLGNGRAARGRASPAAPSARSESSAMLLEEVASSAG